MTQTPKYHDKKKYTMVISDYSQQIQSPEIPVNILVPRTTTAEG